MITTCDIITYNRNLLAMDWYSLHYKSSSNEKRTNEKLTGLGSKAFFVTLIVTVQFFSVMNDVTFPYL